VTFFQVEEIWELSEVPHVDSAEGSVWESDGQIGSKYGIFIPLRSLNPKANPDKLLMPIHTILGVKEVGTMGTG